MQINLSLVLAEDSEGAEPLAGTPRCRPKPGEWLGTPRAPGVGSAPKGLAGALELSFGFV